MGFSIYVSTEGRGILTAAGKRSHFQRLTKSQEYSGFLKSLSYRAIIWITSSY